MTSVLQVASGDGLLLRRPTSLLLTVATSPADRSLIASFDAAADGVVIDAVTAATQHADFAVGSFVVISWDERVKLALFGDIAVVSDHRSMRRLPAAGSQTWIERTIRCGHAERIEIAVDGSEPDASTDLRGGVVRAGGFRLTLGASAVDVTAADPAHRRPPRISLPAPASDLLNLRAARTDPTRDFDDGVPGAEPAATPMPNPAPTWQLRFLDGRIEPVDRPLLLGRRPGQLDATTRPVVIDCSEASSEHVRVEVDGGGDTAGIWLTDLASRNRTWMVTSGDQQLVSLEPRQATQLLAGTHVQVGSVVFVVELATR